MTFAILFVSIVILACLVGNRISNRIGVPMLLIFIVLGMFFGSDGVIRISFENFELAEQICSIALIFIMFYGGFGTKWSAAKPIALRGYFIDCRCCSYGGADGIVLLLCTSHRTA